MRLSYKKIGLIAVATFVFYTGSVYALNFSNTHVTFNLPAGWACQSQTGVMICSSKSNLTEKAILTIIAKQKTPADTWTSVTNSFKSSMSTLNPKSGQTFKSKVKQARTVRLGQQDWFESIHVGGQGPQYDTHYLATLTNNKYILVSLSFHRSLLKTALVAYRQLFASLRLKGSGSATENGAHAPTLPSVVAPSNVALWDNKSVISMGAGMLLVSLLLLGGLLYKYYKK